MGTSLDELNQGSKYVNIVAGIFLWFFGIIGSLGIIIIFSSKVQLRRSPSSQYILAAAILDFIFLGIALGYRIMTDGLSIQGNIAVFFYNTAVCRIRNYITTLVSFATLYTKCLCTWDQWAATCRSNNIRRFSSVKWARIFVTINLLLWILTTIPQLIYSDIFESSSGVLSCVTTSITLTYAYAYLLLPVIYFFVPFVVLTTFGYLTYIQIKQVGQNTLHKDRFRRVERQLTSMIIAQTLLCIFTSVPYGVQYFYTGITLTQSKSSYRLALEALIQHIIRLNLYISSAAPFYIYICLSTEIRRMAIELVTCRVINNNEVVPSPAMQRIVRKATNESYRMKERNSSNKN